MKEKVPICTNCIHTEICWLKRDVARFPSSDFEELFKGKLEQRMKSFQNKVVDLFFNEVQEKLAASCGKYNDKGR